MPTSSDGDHRSAEDHTPAAAAGARDGSFEVGSPPEMNGAVPYLAPWLFLI